MVFLHGGGWDGVDAGWGGVAFEFGDDAGLGVLGNHVAGVDTGVVGEEGVEAPVAGDVEEPVGAAFGNACQVGDGDGEEVEDVGDGGAVEVAVADDSPIEGDHRVVDGGGEFPVGDGGGVVGGVADRPGDLRGAADGVGVLDVVALEFSVGGGEDAGVGDEGANVGGAAGLPGVGPELLQVVGENRGGAAEAFEGHGGGNVGGGDKVCQVREGEAKHAEHAVGTVDEGEAFFFGEDEGGDAGGGQGVGGGGFRAGGKPNVAFAHECEGAVREGGKVPGAAEGSVLVNDGGDAGVEEGGIGFHHHGANTCSASHEGGKPEQHEGADNVAFYLRTGSGGVGAHQAALQLGAELLGNMAAGEGTKAGGDPIDRGGFRGEFFNVLPGFRHLRQGGGVKDDGRIVSGHIHHVGDGQCADANGNGHGVLLIMLSLTIRCGGYLTFCPLMR